jgi:transposase InsO family protein
MACSSPAWKVIVLIVQWRDDYHSIRPHNCLGGLTPEEFRIQETKSYQETFVL